MAQEFFLKTVNNVPADESGNVELTIGVSLLRQEFNFVDSQSFTLNNNYSQVYAIVVQGVTLSNSQYSLNGTNGFTILDPLTDDDFIVVIYALNIGGVTPSYTKAEVDVLLNVGVNGFKTITGNIVLDNSYHNSIITISGNSNITFPSGIRQDFNCVFVADNNINGLLIAGAGVTFDVNGDGNEYESNSMFSVFMRGSNNLMLKGQLL
jgi:hypothetical protein